MTWNGCRWYIQFFCIISNNIPEIVSIIALKTSLSTTIPGLSWLSFVSSFIHSFKHCMPTSNGTFIYRIVSKCIYVSGSCWSIMLTSPLIQKQHSRISRIQITIKAINLPLNLNIFIWNTSDEKNQGFSFKMMHN